MVPPPASPPDRPDWWAENERLREELGLAPYEPPRFADGVPTHEVTEGLEAAYGCTIRFEGVDTEYPDDLTVAVDGEPVATVGRHRDASANTVYELSADEFRDAVVAALDER